MLKKIKKIGWKIMKIHLSFSTSVAILYVALSLIYSPEFLLADIKDKFTALAEETVAITAKVLGPPQKPKVSGSATCSNGQLYVDLDCPYDEGSYSFNIEKDGLPMVDGLTKPQYEDDLVMTGQTYSYSVTAFGPMDPGSAQSDSITVTTPDKCKIILPDPIVNIVTISEKNVMQYDEMPVISSRRLVFTGTTNIRNADISISIYGPTIISAQTTANANGYWKWTSPIDVSLGSHDIYVSATDSLDISKKALDVLSFRVAKDGGKKEDNKKKNREEPVTVSSSQLVLEEYTYKSAESAQEEKREIPLNFILGLDPGDISQGKSLKTLININKLDSAYEGTAAIIRYSIFNEKGESKISVLENSILNIGKKIDKEINIPSYFKDGKYTIKVEIIFDKYNISRDIFFNVVKSQALKLGEGVGMTYPEILSNIGSIASLLILLLLLWLILFLREIRLYLHATKHITEINLRKTGMFGMKRKEANR